MPFATLPFAKDFARVVGFVSLITKLSVVSVQSANPVSDVVLDWDFEEGLDGSPARGAIDTSEYHNDGVEVIGMPTLIRTPAEADGGRLGLSVRGQEGFGSGLRAAEASSLNMALHGAFTVEAIFRTAGDNGRANRTLVQRSDPATLVWSYGLYFDGDRGQANFGVAGADGRSVLIYADVPPDGGFHRLAGVFDHGILSLFVDGVRRSHSQTTVVPDSRPKLGVSVGAIFNGGYYCNGDFARVRLTARALGPEEQLNSGEPAFEGIPISWWIRWFGTNWAADVRARAEADPDQDGTSNLVEFRAGSDPMNPDSGFRQSISLIPRLEWRTVPGGVYRLERQLVPGSTNRVLIAPELIASSTNLVFIDEGPVFPLSLYVIKRIR